MSEVYTLEIGGGIQYMVEENTFKVYTLEVKRGGIQVRSKTW